MLRGIRNMKSLPNGRLFVSQGSPCRGAGSRRLTERLLQICDDLSVSAAPSHLPWKGRLGICASQWLPLIGEAFGGRKSQASPFRGGGSAQPRRRGRFEFVTTSQSAFGCQLPCKGSLWPAAAGSPLRHSGSAPLDKGSLGACKFIKPPRKKVQSDKLRLHLLFAANIQRQ